MNLIKHLWLSQPVLRLRVCSSVLRGRQVAYRLYLHDGAIDLGTAPGHVVECEIVGPNAPKIKADLSVVKD